MKIAIVTGASSGMGREFVRQLSAYVQVDEIWAIARSEERLKALQDEVPCRIRPIPLDLSKESSLEVYKALLAQEKPEVALLVNASGFGRFGPVAEIGPEESANMVDLNCRAAVLLTGAALPFMGAGSHIMNICSCAAFQPLPSLALYAATKAFLLSYTRALSSELTPQGILVTVVCPYWIRDTEFIARAEQTDTARALRHFPFACAAETVARRSLRAAKNGIGVVTPDAVSLLHRIAAKCLPQGLLMHLVTLWHRL